MNIQIIIIDSDLAFAKRLKYFLQSDTTRAYYTTSIVESIRYMAHFSYQLVIMDMSSWEADGLESLKWVRSFVTAPILALSTTGTSERIVQILTVADDFLQKPVDLEVCAAKIHALLRRNGKLDTPLNAPPILSDDGRLLIDPGRRKVNLMGVEITLPRKQFELLYFLAGNAGRVFTREQLYEKVWGEAFMANDNTLNCQMRSLRSNLKSVPDAPEYLHTLRGVGYYFDTE